MDQEHEKFDRNFESILLLTCNDNIQQGRVQAGGGGGRVQGRGCQSRKVCPLTGICYLISNAQQQIKNKMSLVNMFQQFDRNLKLRRG